jgi:hypothetical protein
MFEVIGKPLSLDGEGFVLCICFQFTDGSFALVNRVRAQARFLQQEP